jgi:hypothetical protein
MLQNSSKKYKSEAAKKTATINKQGYGGMVTKYTEKAALLLYQGTPI